MTICDKKSKRVSLEMKYIGWNIGAIRIERKESKGDIELLELTIDGIDVLKQLEKAEKWDRLDQPAKYNLTKYMECSEKLEAVNTHMESAPDRVPRDKWLRPKKSFLLQVLDWIIAHRKILEASG